MAVLPAFPSHTDDRWSVLGRPTESKRHICRTDYLACPDKPRLAAGLASGGNGQSIAILIQLTCHWRSSCEGACAPTIQTQCDAKVTAHEAKGEPRIFHVRFSRGVFNGAFLAFSSGVVSGIPSTVGSFGWRDMWMAFSKARLSNSDRS